MALADHSCVQDPLEVRCGAQDRHPAGGVMTARMYIRVPVRVTISRKSAARIASAWWRRNDAHVVEVRAGAGSIPA